MKIVKLFDEMSDYEIENLNKNRPLDVAVDILIYAYHDGGYDGHGIAVYRDNKNKWHLDEISHCSCNGALDEGFNKIEYTKTQIVSLLKKRIDDDNWLKADYMNVLAEVEKVKRTKQ